MTHWWFSASKILCPSFVLQIHLIRASVWLWIGLADFIQHKNCEISNSGGNIFCELHERTSRWLWMFIVSINYRLTLRKVCSIWSWQFWGWIIRIQDLRSMLIGQHDSIFKCLWPAGRLFTKDLMTLESIFLSWESSHKILRKKLP